MHHFYQDPSKYSSGKLKKYFLPLFSGIPDQEYIASITYLNHWMAHFSISEQKALSSRDIVIRIAYYLLGVNWFDMTLTVLILFACNIFVENMISAKERSNFRYTSEYWRAASKFENEDWCKEKKVLLLQRLMKALLR